MCNFKKKFFGKKNVLFYLYFCLHFSGTLPLANQIIGNATDEDDITAMLNLFCAALAGNIPIDNFFVSPKSTY